MASRIDNLSLQNTKGRNVPHVASQGCSGEKKRPYKYKLSNGIDITFSVMD